MPEPVQDGQQPGGGSWGSQAVGAEPMQPSEPGLSPGRTLLDRLKRTYPHEEPIEEVSIADADKMRNHWWRYLWRGASKATGFATKSAAMDLMKGAIGFGLAVFSGPEASEYEGEQGPIGNDEVVG